MQEIVKLEPSRYYHIYTRGNNKETIFKAPDNFNLFLQLFKKYIAPYAATYAYCLLPNHVHFLICVNEAESLTVYDPVTQKPFKIDLQRQFSHLFNAYTKTINTRYGRTGSLFQERFKRKEVTSELYFTRLIQYIHFNPQHHGLIDVFSEWPYSSYHSLLSKSKTLLQRETVIAWFGGSAEFRKFHEENAAEFKAIVQLIADDDV
ncbi:transposase [Pontibacter sp. E15-1]|uniref:transposase n=1 Tax=Pontibacter sp. E15-1 TaxID=2919918 RepID=UPI001F4F89E2|nr:transposase [Pontibacter sp. E15-1]MCJ8164515.1 transposase [Pontibacter sp. E15-1]